MTFLLPFRHSGFSGDRSNAPILLILVIILPSHTLALLMTIDVLYYSRHSEWTATYSLLQSPWSMLMSMSPIISLAMRSYKKTRPRHSGKAHQPFDQQTFPEQRGLDLRKPLVVQCLCGLSLPLTLSHRCRHSADRRTLFMRPCSNQRQQFTTVFLSQMAFGIILMLQHVPSPSGSPNVSDHYQRVQDRFSQCVRARQAGTQSVRLWIRGTVHKHNPVAYP